MIFNKILMKYTQLYLCCSNVRRVQVKLGTHTKWRNIRYYQGEYTYETNQGKNSTILATADDESKIMAWLSPLEPHVRHQDICNQRVGGIGDWLLETEEFRSWYNGNEKGESDHPALLCYGDQGVRKSYIWYERRLVRSR